MIEIVMEQIKPIVTEKKKMNMKLEVNPFYQHILGFLHCEKLDVWKKFNIFQLKESAKNKELLMEEIKPVFLQKRKSLSN